MINEGQPFPPRPLMLLDSIDVHLIAIIYNHLKCCGDGFINGNNSWNEETRRRDAFLFLEDFAVVPGMTLSIFASAGLSFKDREPLPFPLHHIDF
ncbi:MAG: hypothetical protein GY780_15670 [bacterium]|nr:hypothetical protein [bacterium]